MPLRELPPEEPRYEVTGFLVSVTADGEGFSYFDQTEFRVRDQDAEWVCIAKGGESSRGILRALINAYVTLIGTAFRRSPDGAIIGVMVTEIEEWQMTPFVDTPPPRPLAA